jgi:L-amino acid N-acyltransferase
MVMVVQVEGKTLTGPKKLARSREGLIQKIHYTRILVYYQILLNSPGAPMQLIYCTHDRHASAILDIFNEAIVTSTALYDYKPRPPESMLAWFATKTANAFPVIGLEDDAGQLAGFASYGSFRAWPAYKYSVEHSVYVHRSHRGKGLGRTLLGEIVRAAHQRDVHTLVGAIDISNAASIALHTGAGFEHCGTIRQAAFKFGRWLDLAFYQRVLAVPLHPVDG